MTTEKYAAAADRWSESYANPALYNSHRASIVVSLGPSLEPGDPVVELACGDAGLGEQLLGHGVAYTGVDGSAPMVDAARRRLGTRGEVTLGDLNDYRPADPVAATLCFRAIYYATDRLAFFQHVAGYTEKKLVFDLNPRQYALDEVRADLVRAGFDELALRPFFVPQTRKVPPWMRRALLAAERSGPAARIPLRWRFSYICAAFRSG